MTNTLADYPSVVSSTATSAFVNFTPSTTGVYYFGFQAYSDATWASDPSDRVALSLLIVSSLDPP